MQEVFNLVYHGGFDSYHIAQMPIRLRQKFHALLVKQKEEEDRQANAK